MFVVVYQDNIWFRVELNVFGSKQTMTMTHLGRSSCLLLLLTCLFGITATRVKAADTTTKVLSPRRVLSSHRHHKVRGYGPSSKDDDRRLQTDAVHSGTVASKSYYGSAFSDDEPKGHKGEETPPPKVKGKDKSSKKGKNKGNKRSTPKSQRSESSSRKSSSRSSHDNIFDHTEEVEFEITPVQCGSENRAFLTTFVASIKMQPAPDEMESRDSSDSRDKSTKKSRSKSDSDEDEEDLDELLPFDALSHSEQRILEMAFRNVYNNMTFVGCDGFFRTVYSVSLTLVERDEDEEEYAVTLENTYRSDGTDEMQMRVTNGTLPMEEEEEGQRRRLAEVSMGAYFNNSAPIKREDPSTYVQMVSGGDDLPIYYVSLAAQCRNCEVTESVNFPLLMHPEEDEYVDVNKIGMRQGSPSITSSTVSGVERQEQEEEDVCTCPFVVQDNERETSRRRRHRHRRRLDGHNDLYNPPPNGPTAEQYVNGVNAYIRAVQETQGKLLRVAGIVDLIEPDYFQGENPELMLPPTQAPTVSAQPSISAQPTQFPTISAEPTVSPTVSPTDAVVPAPTPEAAEVTRRPTPPPVTSSPTSAAAKWLVSMCGLVVPALLLCF